MEANNALEVIAKERKERLSLIAYLQRHLGTRRALHDYFAAAEDNYITEQEMSRKFAGIRI